MSEFGKVDVKEIKSDIPRSSFSEERIELLANAILKNDGLIRPLILKQISIDNYSVLDGHLEYYAAVRAREKDARKGEMVNAFVIDPKNETSVTQQIQAIQVVADLEVRHSNLSTTIEKSHSSAEVSSWITSFESRLSQLREDLAVSTRASDSRLQKIENRFESEDMDLLSIINTLDAEKLAIRFSQCGISSSEKVAKLICDSRESKEDQSFRDYQDVVKSTQGFGDKSMLKLIDGWSRISKI